ncbi:DUF416 family protein [Glaciecola sp. 1036]|uniref:DUF416 family protein n=1 Tax=Alteromonadaceae TaxID=72275 RepID=UPI003CFC0882
MTKKLTLFSRLRTLELQDSVIISLCIAERMFINARIYFNSLGEQQPLDLLESVLNKFWMSAFKKKQNFANNAEKIGLLLDEIEDDSLASKSTLDFLVGLNVLIDTFAGSELQPAVMLAKLSQGDIERYLRVQNDSDLTPAQIRESELVIYEIELIESLIEYLASNTPNVEELMYLRDSFRNEKISNLGLSS